ncbi:ATP-dependent zinc metalloprotease FtsH [Pseudoalteromonas sp. P1-16-1b]|uniref:AAA family ATPase n=1 Tax=Pseudoalteromonas sp. P1-16-1b TaxID=1723757 RepID=UPI0006D6573C|nr:AAA family ATPase [Pseudoalteromonas sp. P1-16-1b]KPZ65317.1 ATP-dependent zinc metalloprotease FtsH [Pseudoalteromonas sp. P1-16-1b]
MIDAKSLLNGKSGISLELTERLMSGHVAVFSPLSSLELLQIADKRVQDFIKERRGNVLVPFNMSEFVIESLAKDCYARNIHTELDKLILKYESAVYDQVDELVNQIEIQRAVPAMHETTYILSANPSNWFIESLNFGINVFEQVQGAMFDEEKCSSLLLDLNSATSEYWATELDKLDLNSLGVVGFVPCGAAEAYKHLCHLGIKLIEGNDLDISQLTQCANHRTDVLRNLEDRKRRFLKTNYASSVKFEDGVAIVQVEQPELCTSFDPNDFDVPFMTLYQPKFGFSEVVGNEQLKSQMRFIREQLNNKKVSQGSLPKGLLFSGPPGTGKTFMAEAFAYELGLSFIVINGADVVSQGCAVTNLKKLFEVINKISPCVVFFDEADSLCRARNENNPVHSLAVNTLLAQMDGVTSSKGNCIFIAATNHPHLLDPALLRAGRFEREIGFTYPTESERLKTIKIQSKAYKVELSEDESAVLASLTGGKTHKAIQNVFRDVVLYSGKNERCSNFNKLLITVLTSGSSISDSGISPSNNELLHTKSVHEAGHFIAIKSQFPDASVKMVSGVYGITISEELDVMDILTKNRLDNALVILLGGRAAEEVIFGEDKITQGSSEDMKRATKMAKEVLMNLGAIYQCEGVDVRQLRTFEGVIDKEVNKVVNTAYQAAKTLVGEYRETLEQVSHMLLNNDYLLESSLNLIMLKKQGDTSNAKSLH